MPLLNWPICPRPPPPLSHNLSPGRERDTLAAIPSFQFVRRDDHGRFKSVIIDTTPHACTDLNSQRPFHNSHQNLFCDDSRGMLETCHTLTQRPNRGSVRWSSSHQTPGTATGGNFRRGRQPSVTYAGKQSKNSTCLRKRRTVFATSGAVDNCTTTRHSMRFLPTWITKSS